MAMLVYLIPVALFLDTLGLGAFLWSLRSDQYDDMDGAAERILLDDEPQARPHGTRSDGGPGQHFRSVNSTPPAAALDSQCEASVGGLRDLLKTQGLTCVANAAALTLAALHNGPWAAAQAGQFIAVPPCFCGSHRLR